MQMRLSAAEDKAARLDWNSREQTARLERTVSPSLPFRLWLFSCCLPPMSSGVSSEPSKPCAPGMCHGLRSTCPYKSGYRVRGQKS